MSKVVQLKKKAAECEQKKQYDRALSFYRKAIEVVGGPEDRDIQLYNRIGDLYLRTGDRAQAITYYERAVDFYADGGFSSNAIALCNKVLRYAPERSLIYYKLGKISAKKGFNSDAKQNFLEYAGRMQKAGEFDEAFRALKEFADLCPGQDDIRLMLAEQLSRVERGSEALEQLQIVYDTMIAEDRHSEAAATLDRIHAIDPDFVPSPGSVRRQIKREGLVFLNLHTVTESAPLQRLEFTTTDSSQSSAEGFVLSDTESNTSDTSVAADTSVQSEPPAHTDPLPGGLVILPDIARDTFPPTPPPSDFSNLREWLRETAQGEAGDTGTTAQQTDFTRMLEAFKRGIAENVDESDSESHYDLGVAYMEMGLLTEAVTQFQKVLRGNALPGRRIRAYESLGHCFVEQGNYDIARASLSAALSEPGLSVNSLVGVLYLLGYASELTGRWSEAEGYYKRVVAIDITFRDVTERLRRAAKTAVA